MVFSRRSSAIDSDQLDGNGKKKSQFGYSNRGYRHSSSNLVELAAALDDEEGNATAEQEEEKTDASDTRPRRSRSVLFGEVQVMEFAMELGDNPAVSSGCPLQISWDLQSSTAYDLESYEQLRPPSERRSKGKLRISSQKRAQILLEQGHTMEEICDMTLQAIMIKESREQRIQNQNMDKFYEAIVMTGHRMKKVASLPQFSSLVATSNMKRIGSSNAVATAFAQKDLNRNTEAAVSA
jgi:hypothetical protein